MDSVNAPSVSASLRRLVVDATDAQASASFLARILGVPRWPQPDAPTRVRINNDVTLDYRPAALVAPQQYTFVVSEDEFDAMYGRILDTRARTWADPGRTRPAQLDHHAGGRGICVEDPDGHLIQILTRADDAAPTGGTR
jgi:hypothetical protein